MIKWLLNHFTISLSFCFFPCKMQGMVRPHKYCIFYQNPTHANLVAMVDSCLTTSLPWWLPSSYSTFISQNWELLGQKPLVSIKQSCGSSTWLKIPLHSLVDNLWFPPIQFNLLHGCPKGSDTSCKYLFRELWCHCSLCTMLKEWQEKAWQLPKWIQWFQYPWSADESPCSVTAFLSLP